MTPYCPPNPGTINCKPVPSAYPARGFYLDEQSGLLVFTPAKFGEKGVLAIKANEYRRNANGQNSLVGYSRLEMCLYVDTIFNARPEIIGSQQTITFRVNEETCFELRSRDTLNAAANPDSTALAFLWKPNRSSFAYLDSQAMFKRGRFCWTPHDSDYTKLNSNSIDKSKTFPLTALVWEKIAPMEVTATAATISSCIRSTPWPG
jgi:hypothetical protein